MTILRQISALCLAAGIFGTVVNMLSPRGMPLSATADTLLAIQAVREGIIPLDVQAMERAVRTRSAVVLDARGPDAFRSGHIPGAESVPSLSRAEVLRVVLERVPPSARLVVYCGSPRCSAALDLARWLSGAGYRGVSLFTGGFETWVLRNDPVEGR